MSIITILFICKLSKYLNLLPAIQYILYWFIGLNGQLKRTRLQGLSIILIINL